MPTRSAFCVTGLNSATLEMWIGMSLSTMPPCSPFIGLGRWFFFTWFTPFDDDVLSVDRRAPRPACPCRVRR